MTKHIKVRIAGKEYSLKGENEEILKMAADEVVTQYDEIQSIKSNQPLSTISLLTALNIAEKYSINAKQSEIDTNYIVNEMDKMIEYLSQPVIKAKNIIND